MRDYKARLGGKRANSSAKRKLRGWRSGKTALPKGFQPLPALRGEPVRARLLSRGTLARTPSGNNKQGPPSGRRPPLVHWLIGGAAWKRLLPAALGLWVVAGLGHGLWGMYHAEVREIRVTGIAPKDGTFEGLPLQPAPLMLSAGLRAGMPLRQVDPYEAARRLALRPEISSADVRRIFPARLQIRLQERRAVAGLLLSGGRIALIDGDDFVMHVREGGSARPRLPLVLGLGGNPEPGGRISDVRLNRAKTAFAALRAGGFTQLDGVRADVGVPYRTVLHLSEQQRLVYLPGATELALQLFRQVLEGPPQLLLNTAVVDLTSAGNEFEGRIFLRR